MCIWWPKRQLCADFRHGYPKVVSSLLGKKDRDVQSSRTAGLLSQAHREPANFPLQQKTTKKNIPISRPSSYNMLNIISDGATESETVTLLSRGRVGCGKSGRVFRHPIEARPPTARMNLRHARRIYLHLSQQPVFLPQLLGLCLLTCVPSMKSR